jgi:hypothetical protein
MTRSTDPGSPALTGASNIAFGQGDFYAVTTAGTITFSDSPTGDATLEVGDFIFSNTDIPQTQIQREQITHLF